MKLSSAHVSVASVCAHSQVELTITTFSLGLLPDPYWELGCIFPLKIILGQCPDSGSEPAFYLIGHVNSAVVGRRNQHSPSVRDSK